MDISLTGLVRRHRLKLSLLFITVLVLGLALGPKNTLGPNAPSSRPEVPKDLTQLQDWLARQESNVSHLRLPTAKEVFWATGEPRKTQWSIIYVHGFSASKLETAPLTAQVAKALGANVFYTRLSGHGQSSADLGQAKVQNWFADINEAVEIGGLLGERVVVISCSTGSTLATWFAESIQANQVFAHVFISPNFGPKDKRAELINWPWGHQLAFAIQGPTRGQTSEDSRQNMAWTTVYPTQALFPMMALTRHVRESDLAAFKQPLLVFYSQADQVVDPQEIKAAFQAIGSTHKKLVRIDDSRSVNQHLLVGDIFDPGAVGPMSDSIVSWLQHL